MKLDIIFEKGDGSDLWGRIEADGFLPVTVGKNVAEVLANLKMLIADHVAHEGKTEKKWKNVDVEKITFNYLFDLQGFFDEYDFLNLSAIAAQSGINRSLLAQYAAGIKHPSAAQAKKIEAVVHALAEKMAKVSLVGLAA